MILLPCSFDVPRPLLHSRVSTRGLAARLPPPPTSVLNTRLGSGTEPAHPSSKPRRGWPCWPCLPCVWCGLASPFQLKTSAVSPPYWHLHHLNLLLCHPFSSDSKMDRLGPRFDTPDMARLRRMRCFLTSTFWLYKEDAEGGCSQGWIAPARL